MLELLNNARKQRDEALSIIREVIGYLDGLGHIDKDEDQLYEIFTEHAEHLRRDMERLGDRPIEDMTTELKAARIEVAVARRETKRANNLEQWRGIVCERYPDLWELRPDLTTGRPEIGR